MFNIPKSRGRKWSDEIFSILDNAFGSEDEKQNGKKVSEIIALFSGVVYPLPDVEDLDHIIRQIPEVVIQKENSDEISATLMDLHIKNDQILFRIEAEENFVLKSEVVQKLINNVMRLAMLTYLKECWPEDSEDLYFKA